MSGDKGGGGGGLKNLVGKLRESQQIQRSLLTGKVIYLKAIQQHRNRSTGQHVPAVHLALPAKAGQHAGQPDLLGAAL